MWRSWYKKDMKQKQEFHMDECPKCDRGGNLLCCDSCADGMCVCVCMLLAEAL